MNDDTTTRRAESLVCRCLDLCLRDAEALKISRPDAIEAACRRVAGSRMVNSEQFEQGLAEAVRVGLLSDEECRHALSVQVHVFSG